MILQQILPKNVWDATHDLHFYSLRPLSEDKVKFFSRSSRWWRERRPIKFCLPIGPFVFDSPVAQMIVSVKTMGVKIVWAALYKKEERVREKSYSLFRNECLILQRTS